MALKRQKLELEEKEFALSLRRRALKNEGREVVTSSVDRRSQTVVQEDAEQREVLLQRSTSSRAAPPEAPKSRSDPSGSRKVHTRGPTSRVLGPRSPPSAELSHTRISKQLCPAGGPRGRPRGNGKGRRSTTLLHDEIAGLQDALMPKELHDRTIPNINRYIVEDPLDARSDEDGSYMPTPTQQRSPSPDFNEDDLDQDDDRDRTIEVISQPSSCVTLEEQQQRQRQQKQWVFAPQPNGTVEVTISPHDTMAELIRAPKLVQLFKDRGGRVNHPGWYGLNRVFLKPGQSKLPNLDQPREVDSLTIQLLGLKPARGDCKRCKEGKGTYTECRRLAERAKGACANCRRVDKVQLCNLAT